jgi:hypothetical protein
MTWYCILWSCVPWKAVEFRGAALDMDFRMRNMIGGDESEDAAAAVHDSIARTGPGESRWMVFEFTRRAAGPNMTEEK